MAERLKAGLSNRGFHVELFNSSTDAPERAILFCPDIVHSLHAVRSTKWMETVLSRTYVPWIITLTGTDYYVRQKTDRPSDQLKKNIEKASAVIAFHDEAYNFIKSLFPHFEKKFHVIPQGVEILRHDNDTENVRRQYGLNNNDVVFLIVSGIRQVKNIGYALDAFRDIEMAIPDAKLLLVGSVIEEDEAARVFEISESLSSFQYLGEKTHNEVRQLMSAADILFNTSLHEGMPASVLEAMAEDLPVLATDTSGNRSLVEDGRNGFLVSLDNKKELVEAAVRLAADKTLHNSMGSCAVQIVKDHYSIEQELDSYEKVYDIVS